MNFIVKTSLGILLMIVLIKADVDQGNIQFKKQCEILRCNLTTEICRIKPKCDDLLKCIYCELKIDSQQLPLAPRLLAKSGESKILSDNHNTTSDGSSYDEYYEYDEEDTSDKKELNDENDYLDEYIEPIITNNDPAQPIRKLGTCPKVVEAIGNCDTEKILQPDCRFDTECPGDLKCCEAACGRRVCNTSIKTTLSLCPVSFQCSLNCRLGYRIDSNGCLKCECQSCPSMDECTKNCASGYLKDLFGCDICECNDQCPPFSCNTFCPPGIGYIQSENGCPLCQCALSKSQPIENTSSCQDDIHCPPGFRCLNDARNVPMCQAEPGRTNVCPIDFHTKCNLQCPNGNYVLDDKGCPTCVCAASCPQIKCRANCGDAGYASDENGCQTCKCVSKEQITCSRVLCRMFCEHGFKRDENGCEYCACNSSPQPCPSLNCENACANGYRKDYSGCNTCECADEPKSVDKCPLVTCDLDCKHGFETDEKGCQICSCSRCPLKTCRMYCFYGFKKNAADGCEMCECDWTPVADKIACDERIPCPSTKVCNLNLRLCETVHPDLVNWFLYDFEIKSEMFSDEKFVQTFKNDLIRNIAKKYNLKITQITVSSVEAHGLTSFQIMPFFNENMDTFEETMDLIDNELNSHEFRAVLPAVARAIDDGNTKQPSQTNVSRWCYKFKKLLRARPLILGASFVLICILLFFVTIQINSICRHRKYSKHSESKTHIYDDTAYALASDDDENWQRERALDATGFTVVASDDKYSTNDKRALV